MKKTMAALVIGTICTASAVQAEDGAMYECTEWLKAEPTITLGESWVKMYGKYYSADRYERGIEERWAIAGTDREQQIILHPDGWAGFYDFGHAESPGVQFRMHCDPVN